MKKIAKNDILVREAVDSGYFTVNDQGQVLCRVDGSGWLRDEYSVREYKKSGYLVASYKGKGLFCHRISFYFFNKILDETLDINHIDGNRLNNHPSNLELVTSSENNLHKYRVLKSKPVKGYSKINQAQAEIIRRMATSDFKYEEIQILTGLAKSTISYIVNGKTWNSAQ